MNSDFENKILAKMTCGANMSYIVQDNATFLSTEYKVLQSQKNSCFVPCMKMTYNGQIQLYYLTNNLKSLAYMLLTLEPDSLLTISTNLLSNIMDIKNNGFLKCQNIDISFEHIFVEPTTYKVYLIYLPLNQSVYEDYAIFENELRAGLVKVISELPNGISDNLVQFSERLSDGTMTLEDVLGKVKGYKQIREHGNANTINNARVIAMNVPKRIELEITKDRFVIGKNPMIVDGVISFNNMISRKHCEIRRNNGKYYITDLGSANGTYVNHMKLQPLNEYPIENGDVIRLANSDFQIVIE